MEEYYVETPQELQYFLRLYGISESVDSCEKLLSSIPPLITIKNEGEGHYNPIKVTQLIKRWDTDNNCRICLINTGNRHVSRKGERLHNILVSTPRDAIYDFLDEKRFFVLKNFYPIGLCALMDFDDEVKNMLKWCGGLHEKSSITKEELKELYEKYQKEKRERIEQERLTREFECKYKEGKIEVKSIRIEGDALYFGGDKQKIGVVGVPISNIIPFCIVKFYNDAEEDDITGILDWFFTSFVRALMPKRFQYITGETLEKIIPSFLWLGSFKVKLEKIENRFYIDGILVKKNNLKLALQTALRFNVKEHFITYLKEFRRTPPEALHLLMNGFDVNTNAGRLHFDVSREKKNYYISAGGKKLLVDGGYQPIFMLSKSPKTYDIWYLFKRMSKFIGAKDDLLELMKKAKEWGAEREKRAEKLFTEITEKYKDRINLTGWDGARGYVVKGQRNTYFVSANEPIRVYYYPQRKQLCIIDHESGQHVPYYDKLTARIMALLNDEKVAREISALYYTYT